jgi:hypothetical protein
MLNVSRTKRWRKKALDIEEWASNLREAKVKLKGP